MDEETENLLTEVEDIMCDQVILSSELNVDVNTRKSLVSYTKLRLFVAVIARTVLPAVVGVYYAYLKNQQQVVNNVRRQILPSVVAFLANSISKSLSSVQKGITYPLNLIQVDNKQQQQAIEFASSSSANSEEFPEKCVECVVLHEPQPQEELKADVVFIHGLHGSLPNTWKQGLWRHERHKLRHERMSRSNSAPEEIQQAKRKGSLKRSTSETYFLPSKIAKKAQEMSVCLSEFVSSSDEDFYSKCWPKDWLPIDCPGARVIAVNYTTDPYLWRPVWIKKQNRTNMKERSLEIVTQLKEIGVGTKPIIWVGHSKGGLFVKQIMVDAWEAQEETTRKFYTQTKAIMFYSVPHKGSILADFTLPLLRRSVELTEIQRNCPFVLNLHKKFLDMLESMEAGGPEIFSFIETSYTLMSFLYLRIVPFESADPGLGTRCGVPLDHREICKPAGRDCFLYVELMKLINNAIADNLS